MPLVVCPDCYRQISDVAPACIGCGRPMTSLLSQPPTGVTVVTPAPAPARSVAPVIVAVAAIALAVGAVAFAWRAWSPSPGKGAAAGTPGDTTAHLALGLGETGVLRSREGLPTVMLFESRDDFEAAEKATLAKDDAAYKQLVRSGATFVPAGTRAREVEAVFQGGIRVQLLDGPRPGFAGWAFAECLQSN
jgi:hypothetical protein